MMTPVADVLATAGIVMVAAVAASAVFRRTNVPDVLLLILFGVLAGPVLHIVDPRIFAAIAPVAGIAAVLVILFDGGLDIRISELRRGAGASIGVAILAFLATTALAGFTVWWGWDLPVRLAILLGLCFGGAGIAIVFPLIKRMGVSREAVALVSLECAVSDVLLVVGAFTLASVLAAPQTTLATFALAVGWNFAGGLLIGFVAGLGWSLALTRRWSYGLESVATVGALFLCYAATEAAAASGPLAVLAFGLVLGNSRRTHAFASAEHRQEGQFAQAATFHRQAALAVRAFVFVGLGATLQLAHLVDLRLLGVGFLVTIAFVVARVWALGIMARRVLPAAWDRIAVTLMFPLGLPTAAASLIPYSRFALEGTQGFPEFAAIVILCSIALSSLLVAIVMQPAVRRRFARPAGAPPNA